jgi:hypothetical protein
VLFQVVEACIGDGILVKLVPGLCQSIADDGRIRCTDKKYMQNKAGMMRMSSLRTSAISAGSVLATAPE